MTRIWGALARIPVPVVAALLVLSGVLIQVHETLLARVRATGAPEPEQWIAYLTIKWYWAFIPLAVLALWAPRRAQQGALGRVGAWLNMVGGPLQYGFLLVATLVWGLVLGRGDLPLAVMSVEFLAYLITPGAVVAGIAMARDRAVPRWQGPLVIVLGLAGWLPYGVLVVGSVLAVLLVTLGRRRFLDSPVPQPAP
jgi:hypothetical protein